MTHSYQYKSNLPLSRRKMNARFVGKLKNLCGGIYGLHVFEHFADADANDGDSRDYAYVFVSDNEEKGKAIKSRMLHLCGKYGIGSDFIEVVRYGKDSIYSTDGELFTFHLSEPYK